MLLTQIEEIALHGTGALGVTLILRHVDLLPWIRLQVEEERPAPAAYEFLSILSQGGCVERGWERTAASSLGLETGREVGWGYGLASRPRRIPRW